MSEKQEKVIQFKPKKKSAVAGVILLLILLFVVVLFTGFKIDEIEVTGNKHYSKDQIKDFVLENGYINNTILLMLKNKIKPVENIPFVAKLEVEYISAHKVSITVYEKAMAGCVEYMNEYVYFDQDGYVLEISPTKLEDSPCITGMSFESMELHEKLPIEDEKRFRIISKMTQLIQKYELPVDSVQFTSENEIVLKHADIRIELGDGSNLEEQLVDLGQILEGLSGKKGTLDMKDFDTASGTASFKLDKEEKAKAKQNSEENTNEGASEETGGETP